MKKTNNEISEFVSKSIQQIKKGLSKGYSTTGIFNFDISVTTIKDKSGNIGLHVVGAGYKSNVQQIHRIQFSIIDEKARDRNIAQVQKIIRDLIQELSELEGLERKSLRKKK